MSGRAELATRLGERALELGFTMVGICDADASDHLGFYRRWVGEGRHGEMGYLAREDSIARRADLAGTLDGVRSVIAVAHAYRPEDDTASADDPKSAVVARYARGRDYHDVVKAKLVELVDWLRASTDEPFEARPYVDTGPILERELASRAGLGWFGRNTMLIHPEHGSYFFVGLILLDMALPADEPFVEDRCGTCRACLDACPTGALLGRDGDGAPVMDATRCISYLTIELRGPIPPELREPIGNRVFGCDICQEVCPWNERFSTPTREPAYAPSEVLDGASLMALAERVLETDEAGFRELFRGSPIKRAKRAGLLRNLCVGLGNWGDAEAAPLLEKALQDADPLVRAHAAWGLSRCAGERAADALRERQRIEDDTYVLEELDWALRNG